jgi:dihydroorotase-like cyclic amidohydrolase
MSSFVITDVRVFTGETIIEPGYVYIKDGFIDSVGARSPPEIPNIPVISKPNHTLLPGLIDAHVHLHDEGPQSMAQGLRFGVTTMMDMANDAAVIAELRAVAKTRKDVADIKAAVFGAMVEGGWPAPVILAHDNSPEV